MKEYRIQSIALPTDEKHLSCRKLFYRGDHAILDRKKRRLSMAYAQRCDFTTYINACSYQKWKKYTTAGKLTLHLIFQGEAELDFIGYHKEQLTVYRKDFATKKFKAARRREVTYTFPENDEMMVGFEITALSRCTIYGGYYTVEVDEKKINPVKLAITTTTCRKEEFIKKNVKLIQDELLTPTKQSRNAKILPETIADNLYLHVVDNGRTLKKSDVAGPHTTLHPNPNTGGSGGYARGMIESLHQKPAVTHTLLMDDDVLVLPESIRRTYNLLRLLKPEHQDSFIAGAMLYFENPAFQHEDIGTVTATPYYMDFHPLKGLLDHQVLTDNLENEADWLAPANGYSAWWYSCIPNKLIKKNGLPLPMFIRSDDTEYSLRMQPEIITMNGIAIWHMGFVTKYSAALDEYQVLRNLMISQATTGVLRGDNIYRIVYSKYRVALLQFNYDAAELLVRCLEDFSRGPKWLMKLDGEKNMQNSIAMNEKLLPLAELPNGDKIGANVPEQDLPLRIIDRIIFKLTWNGHCLIPQSMLKNEIVAVPYRADLQPQRITLHRRIIRINKYSHTGAYHEMDKKRFREVRKHWRRVSRNYLKNREKIEAAWSAARDELTSEKFWRKYLGMNKK